MVDEQPAGPEKVGAAIRRARGARSARSLAKVAGISEGRWRQIEAGYQPAGNGIRVPVHPKPTTLAAVARAVGIDPFEALRLAGREAEANFVARNESSVDPRPVGLGLDPSVLADLTPEQLETVYTAGRAAAEAVAKQLKGQT